MDDGEINMHGILFICIKGWQNTDSCSDVDWTFRQGQDSGRMEIFMECCRRSADDIINALGLVPLEREGGLVRETYRSQALIGQTPAGTAIYYFLEGDMFSHLHRLSGDEVYHFYLGDPVELVELQPDGTVKKTVLGHDICNGESVQHLVKAGNWQGSRLKSGGSWALLGTTMCPGYTNDSYEHGDRGALIKAYPQAGAEILRLTTS